MQHKTVMKGVILSASMLFLAACSSTSDESTVDERRSAEAGSQQSIGSGATESERRRGVETGAADRILTPEEERAQAREERQQRYADLRQEQTLYFDFDDASIRGEFAELLAAHADYLTRNPSVTVVIEGHTDERGTPEYNIALGERRAKSVVGYLQSLGVSSRQMSVVSYGEERPVVRQSNERAWAQNRRAILVY